MEYKRHNLDDQSLINFYKWLILPRMIEEKMLILLRQGKISKWFSGIGQEAIAVGSTLAMRSNEFILPLHRNLGVFTTRDVPLQQLFKQWQGKKDGFTKGRDRSFHFGTIEHKIVGMISHLGAQLSVADGIALAAKLQDEEQAALVFTGEGGTSEGEFHEALNVASVWGLPVIFLIENNAYALSTPVREQFAIQALSKRAKAYGIEGYTIDGNNLLEVYHTVKQAREQAISHGKPVLIEAMTFRMRGHEEASGTKYVPDELFEKWEEKDPVENFEQFLLQKNLINDTEIQDIKTSLKPVIDQAWRATSKAENHHADLREELKDVYAATEIDVIKPDHSKHTEKRYVDAVKDGLMNAMDRHSNLVIMGQDIAEYGGVFKVTEGFLEKYGKERVRNTPLCESAIIGTALGLSISGFKSIVEMQFADFVTCGFNQIVNNLAKCHYRWGQYANVVIRMPTGGGVGAGPFHSQSTESWFFHVPGLKIVYPATPYDAKGLLCRSIEDPNPVLYYEHKFLYRNIKEEVPDAYYSIEIGKGKIVNEGVDLSIITYGWSVHWAKEICDKFDNGAIEVVDLRSLLPWDQELVSQSVKKTNKVMVLHEDTITGGVGAEVAAWISENLFEYLDAPVRRVASADTPVPFAKTLEENFLPKNRLHNTVESLLNY